MRIEQILKKHNKSNIQLLKNLTYKCNNINGRYYVANRSALRVFNVGNEANMKTQLTYSKLLIIADLPYIIMACKTEVIAIKKILRLNCSFAFSEVK